MEWVELRAVNDTHYGQFRVPFRENQVPPATQGLQ